MSQREKESDVKRLGRIVNSTFAFCLSFVLITYIGFWAMALSARVFGINSTVYYYGIKFILNDVHWSRFNILFIFASPVFFQLLWGLISLYLFYKTEKRHSIINLVFLWSYKLGIVLGLSHFVSALLGFNEYDSPFYHTIAVVVSWLRMPKAIVIVGLIAAVSIMTYLSISTIRPFLRMSFSFTKVNQNSRKRRFYLELVCIPAIVGSFVCTYYTFPYNFYMTVLNAILLLFILCVNLYVLNFTSITIEEIHRFQFIQKINLPLFVILSITLTVIYFVRGGINF